MPPTAAERAAGEAVSCRGACKLERHVRDFSDAQLLRPYPRCRICIRQAGRQHLERIGPEGIRAKNLKQYYGLTLEDFNEMLDGQGGLCAACRTELPEDHSEIAIDHCYETGHVRGLLHIGCNTGIGGFADNPEWLRRAADYLEATKAAAADPGARFIPENRKGLRPGRAKPVRHHRRPAH